MTAPPAPEFDQPNLMQVLAALDEAALDSLGYGVIGFGKEPEARIVRYNAFESRGSGLDRRRVLGQALFGVVAQCMNNDWVAQRFEDAVAGHQRLDETLAYTFTLRMKPSPVVLRLLSSPAHEMQFIAVRWQT